MRASPVLFVAATMSLAACAATPANSSTSDPQAVAATIDSMDANAQRWFAHDMLDSVLTAYYASDAVVMDPNQPAMHGTDEMRKSWGGEMQQGMTMRLKLTRASMIVADSVASATGAYQVTFYMKPDTMKALQTDHGNYVTTYVKRNGAWRALYDIATSEIPSPNMAPSAPAKGAKKP